MKGLFSTVEQFFWTMIWVALIIIVLFAILSFVKQHGDPLGVASWTESHLQPQG
jgi:hypothetical protein